MSRNLVAVSVRNLFLPYTYAHAYRLLTLIPDLSFLPLLLLWIVTRCQSVPSPLRSSSALLGFIDSIIFHSSLFYWRSVRGNPGRDSYNTVPSCLSQTSAMPWADFSTFFHSSLQLLCRICLWTPTSDISLFTASFLLILGRDRFWPQRHQVVHLPVCPIDQKHNCLEMQVKLVHIFPPSKQSNAGRSKP